MRKVFSVLAMAITSAFGMTAAQAEGVSINGFMTTSVVKSDADDGVVYNSAVTNEARFDNPDSRLGLQFSGAINDYMDATAQLIAKGKGGKESISIDWAFVNLAANENTSVRAGKLKLSTFLISDYIEVGYAYPWIRPPQEVYTLNPINTVVGADALFTANVGDVQWLVQPYFGSNRSSTYITEAQQAVYNSFGNPYSTAAGDEIRFSVSNMAGLNVVANFDVISFRVGHLSTEVDQADFGLDGETAEFTSAGLTMDWNNVVAYAEYAVRNEDTNLEAAFPDQEAYYVTLGYRMGKVLPHITFSEVDYGDTESPLAVRQSSTTLGLRYEFLDGAALKFEAQKVEPEEGTYGLFNEAVEDAMLYGIALDVIF